MVVLMRCNIIANSTRTRIPTVSFWAICIRFIEGMSSLAMGNLAGPVSPLLTTIAHVIKSRSNEKMLWIKTCSIIAGMTNAFFTGKIESKEYMSRKSMYGGSLSHKICQHISIFLTGSSAIPAACVFIYNHTFQEWYASHGVIIP